MFDPRFLGALRHRLSIFDLVGRKVRLNRRGKQATGLCPFHNEKSPSFHVYDDNEPHYHCFGCGAHGDAITFIMETEGLEFRDAVERLAGEAGLEVPKDTPQERVVREGAETAPAPTVSLRPALVAAKEWSFEAEEVWRAGVDDHALLRAYLRTRGIEIEAPATLRFLRAGVGASYTLPDHPRMMAIVTDAITAAPTSLHFTALRPDGGGKAHIDRPKRLLFGHRKAGCVVRLSADDEVTFGLGLAEGIETGLKVLGAGWSPVWAAIDAGNLGAFPVLRSVQSLALWADHDVSGTGQKRAAECAERWRVAGREVATLLPPEVGRDWADEFAVAS